MKFARRGSNNGYLVPRRVSLYTESAKARNKSTDNHTSQNVAAMPLRKGVC